MQRHFIMDEIPTPEYRSHERLMVESNTKSSSGNVVHGFSKRFNYLMDRAGVAKTNRTSIGARRFDVVHNTFKAWCAADRIPGTHSLLLEIVESLLRDIPGRYNAKAVVAWLLAGDAVPNPLGDDTDALVFVDLYLQISQVAKRAGMEFDKLPREARNVILKRVHATLASNSAHTTDNVKLDNNVLTMIMGMLETARTMT